MLTVVEQLKKDGELETGGLRIYCTTNGKVASAAHIEFHARIIAQKYLARELISFSSNVTNKAFDETTDDDRI